MEMSKSKRKRMCFFTEGMAPQSCCFKSVEVKQKEKAPAVFVVCSLHF